MGVVHTKDHDFEIYRHATETTFRKLVFNQEGTRLMGAVFIGDITNAGLYRYVIRGKIPVMNIKRYIIDHTLHYGHFMTGKM
jgi:NAD(P)H-nitrite reductase large subunit